MEAYLIRRSKTGTKVENRVMETAQKKTDQAKIPISDDMLVDIATKAILASNRFPRSTDA